MKTTSAFLLALFLLFLVIVISSTACTAVTNPEKPMVFTGNPQEEFLGVRWDCSFAELETTLKNSAFPTKLIKHNSHGESYQYSGNNQFRSAKYTVFTFLHGKLKSIGVFFFSDDARLAQLQFGQLRDQLKNELSKLDMGGLKIDVDAFKPSLKQFWGEIGAVRFELQYGGDLTDGSDRSVILSAMK